MKKIQVWLIVHEGRIEFLIPEGSYKVKRVRRNPRVICYVGGKNGPAISGTAEIVTDKGEVSRVYKSYWQTHPLTDDSCDRTSDMDRDVAEQTSGCASAAG